MKRKYRKQKNGRERGPSGMGNGAHQNVSPQARRGLTKSREGRRQQADRRQKQRGWE